ncbi:inositol monophosphatase family protein [Streptomyces sp. MP131-18]|uniref:inositol monophosphatase family protein n=1 Tax=Streptomyces sp. MP131-18 TaxID=1857892 RepID=UPI0009A18CEB|nr:inositol monophosphatase family protein [Streptomyces sp. MP131-18]ONK13332.1 Inositol-1-monophosphatase [Streptomyces sp. MP131-18]
MTESRRTPPVPPGSRAPRAPRIPAPPGHAERAALLDLAVAAARAGGVELVHRAGHATGIAFKSTATDPVSDADRAGEAAVVGLLSTERPEDGFLGEEGTDRAGTSGFRWVIDPLDGTVNYLYGIPHTAVSVACEQRSGESWHAVVGVVHDPARGETFTAALGQGACLNGRPLWVNDPVDPASALVATGFAYSSGARARQGAAAAALLPRVRDLRCGGSAALDLCWVAAGRCDAYYEDELGRWDWAAGALIAAEAGAVVTPLGNGVAAAGPTLHPELTGLLAPPAAPA